MGGKGGVSVTERAPTAEESKLTGLQASYIESLQPAINQLIGRGTALLGGTVNPDYRSIYQNSQYNLNNVLGQFDDLGQQFNAMDGRYNNLYDRASNLADERGNFNINYKLPNDYRDQKKDYYNQMYDSTFGQTLNNAAKSGVINSSVLNKSVDSMQKNMNAQMSQDYTNDMNSYLNFQQAQMNNLNNKQNSLAGLTSAVNSKATSLNNKGNYLNNQMVNVSAPMNLATQANASSFGNAGNYLSLAAGKNLGSQGTDVLNAIGNFNNNRSAFVQNSGKGLI